jgi:Collagen triple helix repeat (20 copies)
MSDTSQGAGWWEASDGMWYAPEQHPDYIAPAPEPPPAAAAIPDEPTAPATPVVDPGLPTEAVAPVAPVAPVPPAVPDPRPAETQVVSTVAAPPPTPLQADLPTEAVPTAPPPPSTPFLSPEPLALAVADAGTMPIPVAPSLPPPPVTAATSYPPSAGAARPIRTGQARKVTPLRVVNIVALIAAAVAVFLAWVTAGSSSLKGYKFDNGELPGVHNGRYYGTHHGAVFGGVLVVTALILVWRIAKPSRFNGILLFIGWLAVLAIAAYDIGLVHTAQYVSIGIGLYIAAAAGVVGAATAVMDTSRYWSDADGDTRPVATHWWTWVALVLALAAVGFAAYTGTQQKAALHVPKLPSPSTTTTQPPSNSGSTGDTGTTGTAGNSGNSGNSGNAGNSGNSGTVGSSGNSGNTGNSGNSG